MSSVEDKVVAMKFNSTQFESGATRTLSILDRLKAALKLDGASKGINDVQNAASRFNLNGLSTATDGVGAKFSAMAGVAIGAIANITSRAVDAGLRIAQAFTIEPLRQGFEEYETGLNSVQTILANTQASGANLGDVNRVLSDLNTYADKTIYNFSEMTRNIGTFTAAGVGLDTSAQSIKGIANLAALSGSNSQQASTAMYQLSQAISSGKVSLQDWNSVVNAGMGGTVFQRALSETAVKMGALSEGAVKLEGPMKNVSIQGKSFRESISGGDSWLTSDVLTATLKQFTGDMTDAELATMGFTAEQIKSIQAQAQTATDAATKVKTFTQLIDTLKEAAGSGWAQTFQTLVGDFEEARTLFTSISNVVGGFIGKSADARNKMLSDWKDMGGRTAVIEGLANVFNALVAVVRPIGEAFREIFPPMTAARLMELTNGFVRFTQSLKVGEGTINSIKNVARGFFSIFSIGIQIISGFAKFLGSVFGLLFGFSGGFLDAAGGVGGFIASIDAMLKKGDLVDKFFNGMIKVIRAPVQAIGDFIRALAGLNNPLSRLARLGGVVGKIFGAIGAGFKKLGTALAPVGREIATAFEIFKRNLSEAFKGGDWSGILDGLSVGLLGGILLIVKKFLDEGVKIDFGGGFLGGIKSSFEALTGVLSSMQSQIQAKTLMSIAAAVGILTLSIVALSMIDSAALAKSMTAIGVGFGQLLFAMSILTKISGSAGLIKTPMVAASLILLATALLILSASVAVLSRLSWEELAKGLAGVAALLLMIAGFSQILSASSGAIVRVGIAMIPLAMGILILSAAVKSFASMSWGELAKGMVGLAGSLVIIAGALQLMPKNIVGTAAGLILASIAINLIAKAMGSLGGMSWGEIAKGLVALGGAMLILAIGLNVMNGAVVGAAVLVIASAAIMLLVPALTAFSKLSWGGIAKAMVTLAGSLLILAGAMYLMTGAVVGAAALLIASVALMALAPALVLLGGMSWGEIARGLVMLAGAMVVLAVGGVLLGPAAVVFLALGAAALILGAGVVALGAGLLSVAQAFAIFVAAGLGGLAVVTGMIALIPSFMTAFAQGIIAFAATIIGGAGTIINAFKVLLLGMIDAVIEITPRIGQMILVLLDTILRVIVTAAPNIANAGLQLMVQLGLAIERHIPTLVNIAANIIIRFLQSMQSRVPEIVNVATNLIVTMINAIGANSGRVANAGVNLIINTVNSMANAINSQRSALRSAGLNLGFAIIDGMTGGILSSARRVASAAADAARNAIASARAALGVASPSKEFFALGAFSMLGLALAFEKKENVVTSAVTNMANGVLSTLAKSFDGGLPDVDVNPVITPVLDLSNVKSTAASLADILSSSVPYNSLAGQISDSRRIDDTQPEVASTAPILNFEQNITSPKAISEYEIYTNTRSLLARTREAIR